MAANIPQSDDVVYSSELEDSINNSFDRIVCKVNSRRETLLSEVRIIRSRKDSIVRSIENLNSTRSFVQDNLRDNELKEIQERTTTDFKKEVETLKLDLRKASFFVCNENQLDNALANLGSIEDPPVQYINKDTSNSICCTKSSSMPLKQPMRLCVDEALDIIAVTDRTNRQIYLFTLEGKHLNSFGKEYFTNPYAIKIINDTEMLVTDYAIDCMALVHYERNRKGKFKIKLRLNERRYLTSLEYDKDTDLIYATESTAHSLLIFNKLFQIISEQSIFLFPQNVVLTKKQIYVQDCNNPSLHILSKLTLEVTRSIIPRGMNLDLEVPLSFSLDNKGRIIMGVKSGVIQVYAPSGQLLHTFSKMGSELGEVLSPNGVFVKQNYDVIVLSNNPNYPIQVFSDSVDNHI